MRDSRCARVLLAFTTCLLLALNVGAQELSVRNKPYKGEMKGRGLEMLVRLEEMAKALDAPVVKTDQGWTLGEAVVPTVEEGGVPYIKLSDLKAAGYSVKHNKDFNTIDVNRAVAKNNASVADSGWVMVHFGAPW